MKTIVLPARFDRTVTAALVPEIADAVGTGAVRLDGSNVEKVGQAGLQLMVSACLTAAKHEVAFSITSSDALRSAAQLAGLDHLLLQEPAA